VWLYLQYDSKVGPDGVYVGIYESESYWWECTLMCLTEDRAERSIEWKI